MAFGNLRFKLYSLPCVDRHRFVYAAPDDLKTAKPVSTPVAAAVEHVLTEIIAVCKNGVDRKSRADLW